MGIVGFKEGWTERRTALAVEWWKQGLSAGEIASRLGDITRNAVIGKLSRMGLKRGTHAHATLAQKIGARRTKASYERKKKRLGIKTKRVFISPAGAIVGLLDKGTPLKPLPQDHPEDVATVASVADLEPHHCRWPVGDPKADFKGFCGKKKERGQYCEHHAQRAYQGPWSRISSADRKALEPAE